MESSGDDHNGSKTVNDTSIEARHLNALFGLGDGPDEEEAGAGEDLDFASIEEDLERYGGDQLIADALQSGGTELRMYARRIEADLRMVEKESISDYVSESENLAHLHLKISASDAVMANMQKELGAFQRDLGKVNEEIMSLQERARGMSVRAKNRKAVHNTLAGFVQGAAIPPSMVTGICESDVNDAYVDFLVALKAKFVYSESESARGAAALDAVRPELEKLRSKAVERCREFLLLRIFSLSKPKTNFQILQQNVLLRFRYLVQFLQDHALAVYTEVVDRYVETMSSIYNGHFRTHVRRMARLKQEVMLSTDTLVGGESSPSPTTVGSGYAAGVMGMFSSIVGSPGGSAPRPTSREAVFCLGKRSKVLKEDAHSLLFRMSADSSQASQRHPPEYIFRAILILLAATAESECMFACEFLQDGAPFLLPRIFKMAISVIEEWIKMHVESCYDPVALLLMIRSSQDVVCGLEERGTGQLRPLLDRLTMLLWPRFKAVLDAQMQSVRTADVASLVTQGSDKYPHYVTRRFGELTACVHLLKNTESAEMLDHSLNYMRNEVESLWGRVAEKMGDARRRLVFTINQVDCVLGIYTQRGVPAEVVTVFNDKLDSVIEGYVEAELEVHIGDLVRFVKDVEQRASGGGTCVVDLAVAKPLVEGFARSWKKGIEGINVDVMGSFNNMKNGMEILKRTLTQLLLYYTRFCEVLKLYCADHASLSRGLVNIPTIMAEIRKHSRSF